MENIIYNELRMRGYSVDIGVRPSVIFADTFCSLRLKRNTPDYGICVTNKLFLNEIFSDFYYETWNSDSLIKADSLISHSILSLEILISEV